MLLYHTWQGLIENNKPKMSTFHVLQEGPVNALALNRDYSQVAIGGRNGKHCHHSFNWISTCL